MIEFVMHTLTKGGESHFEWSFAISHGGVIAIASIILAIVLAFYVFRSIGLFTLARRQQIKYAFLAWIPLAWMYTACKLIGNARTFGSTFSRLALIFTLIFGVAQAMTIISGVLMYYPLVWNLVIGNETIYIVDNAEQFAKTYNSFKGYLTSSGVGIFYSVDGNFNHIYSLSTELAINKFLKINNYISLVLDIAILIITINVYIALFRKFWPQHFILASILSIMGLFPIFVFAVRKKNPVNYREYLQSRYNARYNMYGPYGNPYGNPYNNPYGQANGNANANRAPEHPFSEFAERGEVDPGDPFKEFSDKNKEPFNEFDDKKDNDK